MVEYTRSRYERILNEDNSVKEIFIAVRFTKDGDEWEQGYWLTVEEKDAVVADEDALDAICDKAALIGEEALANYKASLLQ